MPLIQAPQLHRMVAEIMQAVNVPPHTAELVARSLVSANLRGVDSHGVQLLPYYVEKIEDGLMDPRAEGHVVSESGACLHYDGGNGLGQRVSDNCCDHAVRLARERGVGMVVARDSNHFGAAAFWAQKISDAGNIGIVMCNASPLVPPWQGKKPRVGTNPICVSVPGPWLLDMATTTVAMGKIFKADINGQETIPAGWAMDADGRPTTSTQAALKGLLMPLGGYKGSGLALMVEILCGALSGGAMALELGGIRFRDRRMATSQVFLAIDIARFMPVEAFTKRVGHLVRTMKDTPPAPGFDEVLVAGDPEWRSEAERVEKGIPLQEGTWAALVRTAMRLGVAVN